MAPVDNPYAVIERLRRKVDVYEAIADSPKGCGAGLTGAAMDNKATADQLCVSTCNNMRLLAQLVFKQQHEIAKLQNAVR